MLYIASNLSDSVGICCSRAGVLELPGPHLLHPQPRLLAELVPLRLGPLRLGPELLPQGA
jgi:hypothetical protein